MGQLRDSIKKLRSTMGWSQEDLARKVDVSLSTVQRWEGNVSVPSRLAKKQLVKLFKKAKLEVPVMG